MITLALIDRWIAETQSPVTLEVVQELRVDLLRRVRPALHPKGMANRIKVARFLQGNSAEFVDIARHTHVYHRALERVLKTDWFVKLNGCYSLTETGRAAIAAGDAHA